MKKFVVIGASAASIAFVTKLRSVDPVSEIVCISGELGMPYNRCFLADYLSKDTTWPEMQLKPEQFFKDQNIVLRLGTWVTRLDIANKIVFVGSEQLSYDYLFLGIGAKPFIPLIGVDMTLNGVFTFHTADDINRISFFIDKNPKVHMVVVGAGLNGLECAASLRSRGIKVTVIERNEQLLPAQVDQEAAIYISQMMKDNGVELLCGMGVLEIISDNKNVCAIRLQSGEILSAQGVIFATGSVVHDELLQGTGIVTEKGAILVDSSMKTNIPFVYAAGDICMVKDSITGQIVKSATWSDAMLQGMCAATQFSDRSRMYPGYIGLRDSVFFGYAFYACGQTIGFDDSVHVVRKIVEKKSMHLFYLKDQKLIGFLLLGDVSLVAQYRQWYILKKAVAESDF